VAAVIVKSIEVPIRTVSEANSRDHWAKKAKRVKAHRGAVRLALGPNRSTPKPPLFVRLTRIAPRMLDDGDNLSSALKAVRDGVADWLGIDDGPASRVGWMYFQEKGKPKQYAVRIEVDV
jgi:hypothetical protein